MHQAAKEDNPSKAYSCCGSEGPCWMKRIDKAPKWFIEEMRTQGKWWWCDGPASISEAMIWWLDTVCNLLTSSYDYPILPSPNCFALLAQYASHAFSQSTTPSHLHNLSINSYKMFHWKDQILICAQQNIPFDDLKQIQWHTGSQIAFLNYHFKQLRPNMVTISRNIMIPLIVHHSTQLC